MYFVQEDIIVLNQVHTPFHCSKNIRTYSVFNHIFSETGIDLDET